MTYVAETAGERFAVPNGSVAAGDTYRLPAGAEEPIAVFVNGVEQRREIDYRLVRQDEPLAGGPELFAGEPRPLAVVFARPILKESTLGFSRWAALYLGLFGTYRTHESVDVHYRLDGRVRVASDVALDAS